MPVSVSKKPAGAAPRVFRRPRRARGERPATAMRAWLEDPGSVTSRIRSACGGEFSLILVNQRKAQPFFTEARILGLAVRHTALIRQVLLCCTGVPWIFARSVLPVSILRGRNRRLANLGSKPLGEVLFALPGVVRKDVQILPLGSDPVMRRAFEEAVDADPAGAWLRRSLFLLDNDPLLVSEVFLSNIRHG